MAKTYACKRCSETGLLWKQLDTGWRLHTSTGQVHSCYKSAYPSGSTSKTIIGIHQGVSVYMHTPEGDNDFITLQTKGSEVARILWCGVQRKWDIYPRDNAVDDNAAWVGKYVVHCMNKS